jgi:CRISPR system Cascade subunit CasD
MLDILLLRFDAPLLSFGGPMVDKWGVTDDHPGLSMLTGLLGNALGYRHQDASLLEALQSRLRYAVRRDRSGVRLTDYQTVGLGQLFMAETGWTTRGRSQERGGGEAKTGTHVRYRTYWADSIFSVALTLTASDEHPDLGLLERALSEPARPLFLGRKCCLPAAPILLGRTRAASLLDALRAMPPLPGHRAPAGRMQAWWFADEEDTPSGSRLVRVTDERDWTNQIHGGERMMRHGMVVLEVSDDR